MARPFVPVILEGIRAILANNATISAAAGDRIRLLDYDFLERKDLPRLAIFGGDESPEENDYCREPDLRRFSFWVEIAVGYQNEFEGLEKLSILCDAVEHALWRSTDEKPDGCLTELDEVLKLAGRFDDPQKIDWTGTTTAYITMAKHPVGAASLGFELFYEKKPIMDEAEDLKEIKVDWRVKQDDDTTIEAENSVKYDEENEG